MCDGKIIIDTLRQCFSICQPISRNSVPRATSNHITVSYLERAPTTMWRLLVMLYSSMWRLQYTMDLRLFGILKRGKGAGTHNFRVSRTTLLQSLVNVSLSLDLLTILWLHHGTAVVHHSNHDFASKNADAA